MVQRYIYNWVLSSNAVKWGRKGFIIFLNLEMKEVNNVSTLEKTEYDFDERRLHEYKMDWWR
jgi:hypothetical protein